MERIGGMALDNGVLLATDSHWAAAVRDRDGAVSLAGGPKPVTWSSHRAVDAVPVLRGPLRMVDTVALMVEVRRRLPKARLPYESARVLGAFVASVLAVGAVRGLPAKKKGSAWLTEAVVAALSVAPALVALRGTALAGYHGAEHKTINAYEAGAPMTVEGVRPYSRQHARCGTAFLLTVALISVIVMAPLGRPPLLIRIASRLALLPVVAGISYEVLRFTAKRKDNRIIRLLIAPNLALQRLTTREPDESMLEVAIRALTAVIAGEHQAVES